MTKRVAGESVIGWIYGRAGKEQVQEMVKLLLGYGGAMVLDESDALAAAICHAQFRGSPSSQLMEDLYRKAMGRS